MKQLLLWGETHSSDFLRETEAGSTGHCTQEEASAQSSVLGWEAAALAPLQRGPVHHRTGSRLPGLSLGPCSRSCLELVWVRDCLEAGARCILGPYQTNDPTMTQENIWGHGPITYLVKSVTLLPYSLPELTFVYNVIGDIGCAQFVDQETDIWRGAMTSQGL